MSKHLSRDTTVEVHELLLSTNSYAVQTLKWDGKTHVIVAKEQSAGRGRLGRQFYSPAATGLYMSVVIYPQISSEQLLLVTPAAALAVCGAIERFTQQKPQIKWVNDILVGGKKISGILTQSVFSGDETALIVGVGVNISTKLFPDDIAHSAASLGCEELDVNAFAAEIVNSLTRLVRSIPGSIAEEYRSRLTTLGCTVDYEQGGKKYTAKAVDIDECCGLIVENSRGERSVINCGEATMHRD